MVRIVLSEPRSEALARLYGDLSRHHRVQVVGVAYDGVEAVQMAVALEPQALILGEPLSGLSAAEVCRVVSLAAPQVPCVLLARRVDLPSAQAALRAGARALWTEEEELSAAVACLEQLAADTQFAGSPDLQRLADPSRIPLSLVGLGAREGQGTTTLLAALAIQTALARGEETVLLDWRPQLTDLPTVLGLRPRHSLADLAPHGADTDLEALSACLTRHESGLWVLPGMLSPDQAWLEPLSRDFAAQLLALLRRRFRFVFCDLPCVLGPAELYLLRHAQTILLPASLTEVGALRAVATLGDLLRAQGVAEEQLRLVVTRQERSRPFSAEDLAKLVGLPITATIPEDPVLPKSLRSGEGTAGRRGPGVEAVRELAEMLTAAVTTCPLPRAAAA